MSAKLSRRAFFARLSARDEGDGASSVVAPMPEGPQVAVLGTGCLAVNGVMCGTCSDPCEPRALRVRPLGGGRALPIIDTATCTGCGECVSVCPVGALSVAPAQASAEEVRCA